MTLAAKLAFQFEKKIQIRGQDLYAQQAVKVVEASPSHLAAEVQGTRLYDVSLNYADGILGAYGQFGLGNHWAVPYYADLGTGTPAFTWQAYLGLKYGNLMVGWRHLAYSDGGNTALLQTLSLGGPMIGYTLHF